VWSGLYLFNITSDHSHTAYKTPLERDVKNRSPEPALSTSSSILLTYYSPLSSAYKKQKKKEDIQYYVGEYMQN
jgi:hypothetical protein